MGNNLSKNGRYIYTVSELTRNIKVILEDSFPNVWVEGEISNFRIPNSGHMYFTLKDKSSQLQCVFFKMDNQNLRFEIKDGLSVVCFGRISVYERQGIYQLYIEKLEPKGVGALQFAFEQLKEKLFKEGLFAEEHKIPIPEFPEKIGIVTSPTGAAIKDILHTLNKRFPELHIIINPVRVQGEGSAQEIANAISEFDRLKNVDLIIVARGGGSLEDLWSFNEEVVARAIYNCSLPLVSAVGHEIDYTISDFVADLRAPTPSLAAEMLIMKKEDLFERLSLIEERLKKVPTERLRQYEQMLDDIFGNLKLRLKYFIELKESSLKILVEKIGALNPISILNRGYSITFKLPEKSLLKKVENIAKGDKVLTRLSKGEFVSRVEEV